MIYDRKPSSRTKSFFRYSNPHWCLSPLILIIYDFIMYQFYSSPIIAIIN